MATLSAVPSTSDGAVVSIGTYSYTVVPQRIGRLRKRLGRALSDLESLSGDTLVDFVGESLGRAHDVLKVFIPDLMPVYEFCGYRSQEAMDADEDEEGEYGPTLPEIINAFEAVMRVNRLDLLGHLRSVVSPELIRAFISSRVAETIRQAETSRTSSSASTPSTPGPPSPSTSTGMTAPTSESNVG